MARVQYGPSRVTLALEIPSRYGGSMLPEALRKDGRAFGVHRVVVEPGDVLHPDYELLTPTPRRITRTGRLIVLELRPKVEGLLGFAGRWDERADRLDIDPIGGSRTARANFRKGSRGYGGHHPVLLPDRRFDVTIRVPGLTVFRGVVSFGLGRELEVPSGAAAFTGYSPVVKIITRPTADQE